MSVLFSFLCNLDNLPTYIHIYTHACMHGDILSLYDNHQAETNIYILYIIIIIINEYIYIYIIAWMLICVLWFHVVFI